MKRSGLQIVLVATATLWCAGCCCTQIDKPASYIAVREEQFRSEKSKSDRIGLPLDGAGRDRLLRFLRTGGNNQLASRGEVDPGAGDRYARLLNWLAVDHQLGELLTLGPEYFTTGPMYEVVDAREPVPLSDTQVVAMGDGYYWWVFYHPRSKHLDSLLVTRVIGAKPQEN